MKKIYIILIILFLLLGVFLIIENKREKKLEYNNLNLAINVDGTSSSTLPTGNYFLTNYSCTNNTTLEWDRTNNTLTSNNYNINDSCNLEFKSVPKLNELVTIGDYISYIGNNGCTSSSCKGLNTNHGRNSLYGYCHTETYQFYTYGWRVAYIKDNSVYIVAAGSPECVTCTKSNSANTISSLKMRSLRYCNSDYLQDGVCDETTSHPLRGEDFYNITKGLFGDSGARYLYNSEDDTSYGGDGVVGPNHCLGQLTRECGYNNDLIDNGGLYWFGNASSSMYVLSWTSYVTGSTIANTPLKEFGLRPVLKLDSTITVTGGSGTMEDPYTISERVK